MSTPINKLRSLIALLLAFSVSGCGWISGNPGYCADQHRYLSDQEFMQIAIRRQVNSNRMEIDGSDASIRSFLENNPNCCRVDRDPEWLSFIDRLFGFYVVDVEVNFKVRKDRQMTIGQFYEGHALIRSCGEIDSVYGSGTKTLKEITKRS
jgi:hypothetical protein